jgi:hypothetical protein
VELPAFQKGLNCMEWLSPTVYSIWLAEGVRAVLWAGSNCAEGGDRLKYEAGLLYVIE